MNENDEQPKSNLGGDIGKVSYQWPPSFSADSEAATGEAVSRSGKFVVLELILGMVCPVIASEVIISVFFWLIGQPLHASTSVPPLDIAVHVVNLDYLPVAVSGCWVIACGAVAIVKRRRLALSVGLVLGGFIGLILLVLQFTFRIPAIPFPRM